MTEAYRNMAALLLCRKAESVRKEYGTGGFLLIGEKDI